MTNLIMIVKCSLGVFLKCEKVLKSAPLSIHSYLDAPFVSSQLKTSFPLLYTPEPLQREPTSARVKSNLNQGA